MDTQRLQTDSLQALPQGAAIQRILAAALDAVEPAAAVRRHLQRDDARLSVDDHTYDLRDYERVLVVGAGKAGAPMARAAADVLGDYLTAGVVIVKDEQQPLPSVPPLTLLAASHPLPDARGIEATQHIVRLLEQATERDLVLLLISGGGSALLTLPAPGIELEHLQQLTSALLASGASINEINSLRKHLDLVKGGGLARMAAPATLLTLILSDVVGNPLDVIASGPTVPDSSSFADAYAVLEHYALLQRVPAPVLASLQAGQRGEREETPGPEHPAFARTRHVLVGSNQQAAAAALGAAHNEGMHTLLLTTYAQGEARFVGRMLAAVAREMATTGLPTSTTHPLLPRPACLVVGGETTVTLRGSGHGGRNQELALAAVRDMAGLQDVALVTLATDGGDGPTDAAGAVVTGETLQRAARQGLDPDSFLANNDAYPFFAALDDLLRPGATHTNVNDLAFVFVL
jgi:hydroxypyruvate reductase